MTPSALLQLLAEVERGAVTPQAAAERLVNLPFEDLGHSRVDHHRSLRTGLPEVVFAAEGERLSIRHDAGESPAPYIAGTLIAIRAVPARVGLTRGLDQLF